MKVRDTIAIIAGIIIFFFLFGSIFTVVLKAPDNAVVYADPEKKVYYAPPYIDNLDDSSKAAIDVKKLQPSTLKKVRELKFVPDEASREKGYFEQNYRSYLSFALEKIGLAEPLPLRWTGDGAWNW
jgi:hypothetical protein